MSEVQDIEAMFKQLTVTVTEIVTEKSHSVKNRK